MQKWFFVGAIVAAFDCITTIMIMIKIYINDLIHSHTQSGFIWLWLSVIFAFSK